MVWLSRYKLFWWLLTTYNNHNDNIWTYKAAEQLIKNLTLLKIPPIQFLMKAGVPEFTATRSSVTVALQ